MKTQAIYLTLALVTTACILISTILQVGTAEIYVAVDGQQVAVGPAIVDALNSGGLCSLQSAGFPRATQLGQELWLLEVNGQELYVVLDWNRCTAWVSTDTGTGAPDVEIHTGGYMAQQLYVLISGGTIDKDSLGLSWLFTGIEPQGYWEMITGWLETYT